MGRSQRQYKTQDQARDGEGGLRWDYRLRLGSSNTETLRWVWVDKDQVQRGKGQF